MDNILLKSLLIKKFVSLKQTMLQLGETSEKILFVVDDQSVLLGTVTDGDIRRGLLKGLSFSDNVDKVMQPKFIYLRCENKNLNEKAKKLMIENKIEQIPILDDKGLIIDIILWTDFFKVDRAEQKREFPNQVVIMAGGKGTRLDPFTKILPKPLIPIGDKTVIEIIMDNFYKYGFSNFIYTLNYKKEYIKLFLNEAKLPYNVDWIEEEDFLGTAGSLSLLKDKINDTFFVVNCDTVLTADFEDALKWHREQKASITIVGCYKEVRVPYGVLELNNGCLQKIIEKPSYDFVINTGIYIIEPAIISLIPENTNTGMDKLINMVLTDGGKVSVYTINEGWFDVGQWDEYRKSLKRIQGEMDNV